MCAREEHAHGVLLAHDFSHMENCRPVILTIAKVGAGFPWIYQRASDCPLFRRMALHLLTSASRSVRSDSTYFANCCWHTAGRAHWRGIL